MFFLRVEDGKKDKKKIYLPLLLVDEMRSRLKDLIVCKNQCFFYSGWSGKSSDTLGNVQHSCIQCIQKCLAFVAYLYSSK